MARKQAGDLHKVTVVQVGHTLIRVCVNCGGSWQLVNIGPLDNSRLSWKPIAEVDENDKEIRFDVDIRECEYMEDSSPTTTQPAARGLAAVESTVINRRGPAKVMCYCKQCDGRSEHFEGSKFCHCNSCKGKRAHYAA